MIQPSKNYILVEEYEEKEQTGSGLVTPPSAKDKPIKARVIAVGQGVDLKEGDVVYHHRWDTMEFEEDGRKLKFVKSDEILGKEVDG